MARASVQPSRYDVACSDGPDEATLIADLRARSPAAFAWMVDCHHAALIRVARGYVGTRALAEEVAQEAWLGLIEGIHRFEGRSSLRTWLFRILVNRAISRHQRERRTLPFSQLAAGEAAGAEAALEPERFLPPDHPSWPNTWAVAPQSWAGSGEERVLAGEARAVIQEAIDALPPAQRTVITLRDVEGWPAEEVRNALEISQTNQRVLLHRARAKVRRALETYLEGDADSGVAG